MSYFRELVTRASASGPRVHPAEPAPAFGAAEPLEGDVWSAAVALPRRPAAADAPMAPSEPPPAPAETPLITDQQPMPAPASSSAVSERSVVPPMRTQRRSAAPRRRAVRELEPPTRVEVAARLEVSSAAPSPRSNLPLVASAVARASFAQNAAQPALAREPRRAVQAAARAAVEARPQSEISITIGRIDVRASTGAPIKAPRDAPRAPQLSLEQFLADRGRGVR